MIRAGGWGPAFSDEGGGFWIGREAIRAALRANDAGETAEFVSDDRQALLKLRRITEAPAAWKDGALDVRSVAALASVVIGLYPADPANQILDRSRRTPPRPFELARQRADLPESCLKSISGSVGKSCRSFNSSSDSSFLLPPILPREEPSSGPVIESQLHDHQRTCGPGMRRSRRIYRRPHDVRVRCFLQGTAVDLRLHHRTDQREFHAGYRNFPCSSRTWSSRP